jgi:hypothetical protein
MRKLYVYGHSLKAHNALDILLFLFHKSLLMSVLKEQKHPGNIVKSEQRSIMTSIKNTQIFTLIVHIANEQWNQKIVLLYSHLVNILKM